MPNVGDELHHFGYSADQERLIVPGLFSNRLHVFDVLGSGRRLRLRAVNEGLAAASGYIVPHSVIAASQGHLLITMIGAATGTTQPAGLVVLDDQTGAFVGHFGPGPVRAGGELGPAYMYDFDALPEANRGISSTFGPPGACGGGIDPACLGDEVAVWDLNERRVVQVASLGAYSGALKVRFIEDPGVRRAFINTPGTSAIWLADDDDRDGMFDFQQVLGPQHGLLLPVDMLLSYDHKYLVRHELVRQHRAAVRHHGSVPPGAHRIGVGAPPEHAAPESGRPAAVCVQLAPLDVGQRRQLWSPRATTTTGSGMFRVEAAR